MVVCPSLLLLNTVLEVLAKATGKRKLRHKAISKEEVKLLFKTDRTIYTENTREPLKQIWSRQDLGNGVFHKLLYIKHRLSKIMTNCNQQ